jgi:hypothetical protein
MINTTRATSNIRLKPNTLLSNRATIRAATSNKATHQGYQQQGYNQQYGAPAHGGFQHGQQVAPYDQGQQG